MKKILCRSMPLLIFILCLPIIAMAEVTFTNNTLTIEKNGQKQSFPANTLISGQIKGTDLMFATLDEDQMSGFSKKPTMFLFNQKGKLVGQLSSNDYLDVDKCFAVSASPKGDILAFDQGTWLVRSWTFFSYPDLKPLNRFVSYLSTDDSRDIAWIDNDSVIVTGIDDSDKQPRKCDYDPCGIRSVIVYKISDNSSKAVYPGTELCDYTFFDFNGGEITATKTCAPNIDDWATSPEDNSAMTSTIETKALF